MSVKWLELCAPCTLKVCEFECVCQAPAGLALVYQKSELIPLRTAWALFAGYMLVCVCLERCV